MEMKLLVLFVVMNIVNVVLQTIKSLATVKCGKWGAAIVNAVAYGLYTYIVVLTMCDLPLLAKCLIVAGANFVGVYVVKYFEEKARKDKLWKVECTVPAYWHNRIIETMNKDLPNIPYNYIDIGKYYIFNFYCESQTQSSALKGYFNVCDFPVKYFVSESKTL